MKDQRPGECTGTMVGKWPVRPLGELTDNFDASRVPVKEADRRTGPYPYYGASGVVDHVHSYLFDGEYLLIAEDGENLRTRSTSVAFLARGRFWVNNHAHIVQGNSEADTRFLMYALSAMDISGYLTGSTMPKLTQDNMNRISLLAPPLPDQRAIAHILGTLDDKIELNRRLNETLEEMARALFKSWFVDFDPVRAKIEGRWKRGRSLPGLPAHLYDLFPDQLVDSELGKIPRGWEVVPLSEVTTVITKGTTPTQEDIDTAPDTDAHINYVRVNAIDDNGAILIDKLTEIPKSVHLGVLKRSILRANDLLYTIAGTIGRVSIVEESLLPANTNQAVAIIRPKPTISSVFLSLTMRQAEFREELHSNIVHAVQANLSLGILARARAVVPPNKALLQLFAPIECIGKRISSVRAEARTLAALRDALLPKLVSGKLRVRAAERIIEGVQWSRKPQRPRSSPSC